MKTKAACLDCGKVRNVSSRPAARCKACHLKRLASQRWQGGPAAAQSRYTKKNQNNPEFRERKRTSDRGSRSRPEARERYRDYQKRWHLNKAYGLTLEQFQQMNTEQGGVCKTCKKAPPAGQYLSVDHSHETGKVRALLCSTCNFQVGIYEKNHQWITAYLEAHS